MSSDHAAILLSQGRMDWGYKPFKVYNAWLAKDDFLKIVTDHWGQMSKSNLSLHGKLKSLRWTIKEWYRVNEKPSDVISHLENRRNTLLGKSDSEPELQATEEQLWELYREQEQILRQQAKLNWELHGDSNSKYFHRLVQYRRKQNHIHGILHDGIWYHRPDQIKNLFLDHFEGFFNREQPEINFDIQGLITKQLSVDEALQLEREFTLEELFGALMSMDSNKSPGPDGISVEYLKKMWTSIHADILKMVQEFCYQGKLPNGLNSSFICLIPKKETPTSVCDFRPISLINCVLKILLKALSLRLGQHIPSLVSEVQSGFIKSRNITDSFLVTQEVVHSLQSKRVKGFILKLDFEKAFDSVNWNILFKALNAFGFGNKWIQWIKVILESTRMSILVNGSPTREFGMSRGLRQGDPMSPMLFNLVAELLHLLLDKATELGFSKGLILGTSPPISHVQYVDDTILFFENSVLDCQGVKLILRLFQISSGLKINFRKNVLYAHEPGSDLVNQCAQILGCQSG